MSTHLITRLSKHFSYDEERHINGLHNSLTHLIELSRLSYHLSCNEKRRVYALHDSSTLVS